MITRRKFAGAMLGVSIAGVALGNSGAWGKNAGSLAGAQAARQRREFARLDAIRARLAEIEAQSGGRLGVSIVDTTSGLHAGLRADERFPMCSTFKLLAAGAVLARVDRGEENLQRRIVYSQSELVPNSPATSRHTRERTGSAGMSIAELCKAAITLSDNTAANLLLQSFGGPAALTAFARSLGDGITRLDRNEPTLNEATPGDPRDTTTPNAMLGNLRALVMGEQLSSTSRVQLLAWLAANETGGARIRARLPKDWGVGDKTGTGDHGTANDVAILWPPGRGPILLAVYLTGTAGNAARSNAAIADVGALVVESV
ncbi:class A beta-lactamase [bacterium M00.F.Ca.ET.228.01.1.1]|uniref:class A beta-lactamase n=1 Tax=Paraburkholderia phenoliruptrix TaxID=252970 RepID=UPI001091EA1F|nr:class A beta-lactamase [Paraburkholderia phenoliruptrix]TGP47440.1 class A beta-lactamase [bacterium M00.F.Ca.ET.228.01.1.1]TGS05233.1 class A beta-lactamase [bacterium M00.F.Ca.ET.191.01.1.1]TGU10169.1 class A beta-lactamase [bacterium M00.F.Ca.ET.155.01.1.1]MBW0449559.1 class A beta-lactamase [Paraburkholderia phenoliruptrix]MBW9101177.1 class A beta-lactamase [Paraburkholderia phenoliruptrix]